MKGELRLRVTPWRLAAVGSAALMVPSFASERFIDLY